MPTFLTKLLLTTIPALVASYFLNGVHIDSVFTAFMVAAVLGLLNAFIKPILILLTLPITIITLGLFLIIINMLIIKWAADLVPGFEIDGWWAALLFSLIVSLVNSLLESMVTNNKKSK